MTICACKVCNICPDTFTHAATHFFMGCLFLYDYIKYTRSLRLNSLVTLLFRPSMIRHIKMQVMKVLQLIPLLQSCRHTYFSLGHGTSKHIGLHYLPAATVSLDNKTLHARKMQLMSGHVQRPQSHSMHPNASTHQQLLG